MRDMLTIFQGKRCAKEGDPREAESHRLVLWFLLILPKGAKQPFVFCKPGKAPIIFCSLNGLAMNGRVRDGLPLLVLFDEDLQEVGDGENPHELFIFHHGE
jgi:hypothetical protein